MQHKERYPKNWNELSLACKERANWTCEHCGLYIPKEGIEVLSRKGKTFKMYLAACHLDHDTENTNPRLAALCLYCHAKYDYSALQIERRLQAEIKRHAILIIQAGYTPAKTRLDNISKYQGKKRKEKITA